MIQGNKDRNKHVDKCVVHEIDGQPSVPSGHESHKLGSWRQNKKQKPMRQLVELALLVLRGLSTCYPARSCALALQVIGHAHKRGEKLKKQKEKQEGAQLLSCVIMTRGNPCFGSEKQPASAAGRDEPSCWQRPRKWRSERCDKHLDHMTLTTRLPLHVSVDFCHAPTCTQNLSALRDATVFFFSFKPKASCYSVSHVAATSFYCSPFSIMWTHLWQQLCTGSHGVCLQHLFFFFSDKLNRLNRWTD